MSHPNPVGSTTHQQGSDSTTHILTYPSGVGAGDRLVAKFIVDGAPGVSGWPSGWTVLATVTQGTSVRAIFAEKIANGSESGTFDLTTSVAEQSTSRMWRVTGAHPSAPSELLGHATTGTNTHDIGELTPTWGSADTLWFMGVGHDDGRRVPESTFGFSSPYDVEGQHISSNPSSPDGCGLMTSWKKATAASSNPGPFIINTADEMVGAHIAVRPSTGVHQVTLTDGIGLGDTFDPIPSSPSAVLDHTDVLTLGDSGTAVAGPPAGADVVTMTDSVTATVVTPAPPPPSIPSDSQQVASQADWAVFAMRRIPAENGPPSFVEVDQVPFGSLSWTRRINAPDHLVLSVPVRSLGPSAAMMVNQGATPLELWVFRFSQPMFAGPMRPGVVQQSTVTVNASGVLDYLRGMAGTPSTLSFQDFDQAAILKALVDHYQGFGYGHFGVDTSDVVNTGVIRTRNYLPEELGNVLGLVENLSQVIDGLDFSVRLSRVGPGVGRFLQAHYPQKGRNLTNAVVLDANVVASTQVTFGAGAQDVASVGVVYGDAGDAPPVRGEATDQSLLASYGRWAGTETAQGVSDQATATAYAAGLVASRRGDLYLPGPGLRSTAEVNPASIDTGDSVVYDFDDGLSGTPIVGRLAEIVTTVNAGGEEMRVQIA